MLFIFVVKDYILLSVMIYFILCLWLIKNVIWKSGKSLKFIISSVHSVCTTFFFYFLEAWTVPLSFKWALSRPSDPQSTYFTSSLLVNHIRGFGKIHQHKRKFLKSCHHRPRQVGEWGNTLDESGRVFFRHVRSFNAFTKKEKKRFLRTRHVWFLQARAHLCVLHTD